MSTTSFDTAERRSPRKACFGATGKLTVVEQLYRDHWVELRRALHRYFGAGPPEPDDVAQAAFARFAAMENPAAVENPRAYLFSVARNIVVDHKRRQKRQLLYARAVLAEHDPNHHNAPSPECVALERERLLAMERAIEALPHKQKVVLSLHRRQGLTYQQISKQTGWSYGDVYRQMEAALAALSRALKR